MKHVKPDQHYPLTAIEAGMFLIFDIERSFDEHVCRSEDDVRQFIKDVDAQHFCVVQFFLDEGNCRDVTADFVPDEPDDEAEPFEGDYCHTDHFRQLLRSGQS